jgi:hypothetical protein
MALCGPLAESVCGPRPRKRSAFGLVKKIEDVRLHLGPALVVTADLEIRLLRPFKTFLLGKQVQIGCSFANISMQMRQTLESFVTTTSGKRRGG